MVAGGEQRYNSVLNGLDEIKRLNEEKLQPNNCEERSDIVLIHDGARPLVNDTIIKRAIDSARKYKAAVAAVSVKDTIKISDENKFAISTPDRTTLWQIQTPQAFEYSYIYNAYKKLFEKDDITNITDDAMVVETIYGDKIKLVEGAYENIKVTTPEDLLVVEALLKI